ncbi:transmembrane protein 243 [Grus japonensis]|uniref:Transmembrane protein 243 n=1 Tax=Grus japonensis TaxID=30415 RepID=A0ABC9VSB3_GRUJA
MEGFAARGYGTGGTDNRPLFGETSARIYWYRQGDLEPKFRNLIYYILFSIVMLCICANLYFHEVGK